MKIFQISKNILKGYSLAKTLQNIEMQNIKLHGEGIDLGAKSPNASYYNFLSLEENVQIKFADYFSDNEDLLKINLEENFPLENLSQDFVLLQNVLEHIFNYQNCINEIHRILKPSGKLIGSVPFLRKVHLDPDDFFRYTESALIKIFQVAGFKKIKIIPAGYGNFTAGVEQYAKNFKFRLFICLIYLIAIFLDSLIIKMKKKNVMYYPLTYVFICEKYDE